MLPDQSAFNGSDFPAGFMLVLPEPYLNPTLSRDEARTLLYELRGGIEFEDPELAPILIAQLEEWFPDAS